MYEAEGSNQHKFSSYSFSCRQVFLGHKMGGYNLEVAILGPCEWGELLVITTRMETTKWSNAFLLSSEKRSIDKSNCPLLRATHPDG